MLSRERLKTIKFEYSEECRLIGLAITDFKSINEAKRINIIGPYYQDLFNENKINFKYYDKENKCIRNGPDLIITTLTSDSIFYKIDDQDFVLSEFF